MLIAQIICLRITEIFNIYYMWDKNRKRKKAKKSYLKNVKEHVVSKVFQKIYAKKDWVYVEDSLSVSKFQFRPSTVQVNFRLRKILAENAFLRVPIRLGTSY